MKTILKLFCAALLGLGFAGTAAAATGGTVTFNVTINRDGGNEAPNHIQAIWVSDSASNFIRTLDYRAKTRKGYLYQWINAPNRAGWTNVDGTSSATISTYNPITTTWNCTDTNGVVVSDGTYKFFVEFTEYNGQGYWTTNGISFTKSTTAYTNSPTQVGSAGTYINAMKITYAPSISHELAVTGLSPSSGLIGTNVTVTVAVANQGTFAETFAVVVSNLTSSSLIGTQQVNALAAGAGTNLNFQWNTTNLAAGTYQIQATAGPVAGEANTANNTLTGGITLQSIPHDIAVLRISPSMGYLSTNMAVQVLVTNETTTSESFGVVLSNLTGVSLIATQQVNAMAGNTASNLSFTWNTLSLATGAYILQAIAGPVSGETGMATADNTLTNAITLRVGTHDVGIIAMTAPFTVVSNSSASVNVVVTNRGDFSESFNVQLFDDTAGRLIGSNQLNNVASLAGSLQTLSWKATNVVLCYHALRAVASPVPGETRLTDNTNNLLVPVAIGLTNRTLLAKGSFWRYNDKGFDLSGTPWNQTNYYDLVWNGTNAPLGYDDGLNPPGQTNLNNVLSWGPDVNNKFITYYFRTAFNMDARPNNLIINTRYDDGVVLYLNGAELARYNMPTGAITATTLAASTISGAGQYVYYSTNASPTNLVFGRNVLAAELHQSAANGSDIGLDLEMLGVAPNFPQVHEVDALAISTPANVLAGDKLPVTITLTNAGNGTESVLVVLQDAATGQIIGTRTLTDVHPADSASVRFDWNTLGATNGMHTVLAYTVVAGMTNLAGAATAPAIISGSGFGLNAVNATGSMGGRCSAVTTTGNLLLVGAGATLEVWDRSNPMAPAKVGAVRLPGIIQNIVVSGSWAFAACGNAGVQFVDLTSASSPRHKNTFNTSGHAYSVALSGNYLYVADGVAGLRVVNVLNPTSPWLAGVYYTEGPARAITVLGTTAYLLDQQKGLLILDVSSPASPTLAGAFTDLNSGQSLAVSANLAYIVDGNNHFLVVNVATPTAPTLAGSLLLSGMVGQSLALNGATVYVAAGDSGLLTIDATTPSAPVLFSTLPTPGQAVDLVLAGSKLYLADGLAGFQVLDVTSPASPVVQADMPIALRATDVVVTNNLAYVASGETGLRIFSLTNPAFPVLLSRFAGAANARCVAVSGSTAYVGDGQYGLKVVNVAVPSSPVLLGAYSSTNLGSIRSIGAAGNLILISDGRNVQLLDASSPANPLLVSTYNPPTFAFSLRVAGSKAYLACGNSGLIILNITPSALTQIGSYDTAGLATGVSVSGNNAYVADGASGWLILDVSNPASPTLLKTVTAQGLISDVAVSGTTAALGNGANTAITVDARNPLSPVAANSFGGLVRAMRVAVTPSLTLAIEDEAGLAVLGNDLNNDGLPDWWEQQIVDASLATNGPIRSIWDVHPTDDFDHDGLSNLAEFIAGTSPVDPNSRLALFVPTSSDGLPVTVRWTSAANKIYTVWRSTNLALPNSFVIQQDNIPATPPVNTYTDLAPSNPAFYIISVR